MVARHVHVMVDLDRDGARLIVWAVLLVWARETASATTATVAVVVAGLLLSMLMMMLLRRV
jgi:hypothetical protein